MGFEIDSGLDRRFGGHKKFDDMCGASKSQGSEGPGCSGSGGHSGRFREKG
jgi:hypothetical protein